MSGGGMIDVYLDNDDDTFITSYNNKISYTKFKKQFLEICSSHHSGNKASVFAFIIYDYSDSQIRKILRDSDYWTALHHLSGDYITIFGFYEKQAKARIKKNLSENSQISNGLKHKANADLSVNYAEILKTYFGTLEFSSPSMLIFQVNQQRIIDYFFVALKEEKMENGFIEIKKVIQDAVDAIKEISPENKKNFQEIFNMVEINIDSSLSWNKYKKRVTKAINLISFLSIFK